MIEQGLFKRHFVGRDGFIWWIGQVVSDKEWVANISGNPTDTNESHLGFDYRYKVRIMGYHTAIKSDLTDNDLPWASVMLPVTAGGGGGNVSQTPLIKQGNFVYGFFLDGEDAQQPIIMGIIGYNQYTPILGNSPEDIGFKPFTGYNNSDPIATYGIKSVPNAGEIAPTADGNVSSSTSKVTNDTLDQSVVGQSGNIKSIDKVLKGKSKKTKTPLPKTTKCDKFQPGVIQLKIQELIQSIESAKKSVYSWKENFTSKLINEEGQQFSLEEYIAYKVSNVARFISGGLKNIISDIQKFITRKVNNGLKDLYFILFPNEQQEAKKSVDTAMDLLACLFKRIIQNLFNIVLNFLNSIIDRFINAPLCAIENFIAALLGKLTGLISSAVDAILRPLNAIFGVIDLFGGVADFIVDILSFLKCEIKPSCPKLDSWSLDGNIIPSLTIDIDSFISKIEDFASGITQSIDPDNFNFDLDFSDIFEDTCNVGPIFCGPPNVVFFGGGGSGASGNAVVNSLGEIVGIDIINSGSGYTTNPLVILEDACGNGSGAVIRTVIGSVSNVNNGTNNVSDSTTNNGTIYVSDPDGNETGVTGVVIEEPGFGYLPTNDGSQGGDRRTWSTPEQTVVQRENGTYDIPYNPGDVIDLFPGDTVRTPPGSNVADNIPGGTYTTVNSPITITAPAYNKDSLYKSGTAGNYPYDGNGRYPVITYLCDVKIADPGFGYQEGDQIIIEPNYGAKLEPVIGEFGKITKVNIISSGEGFKEFPLIYIESSTGSNAKILPRFCIDRIGEDELKEPGILDKVVTVVDCVGKN